MKNYLDPTTGKLVEATSTEEAQKLFNKKVTKKSTDKVATRNKSIPLSSTIKTS